MSFGSSNCPLRRDTHASHVASACLRSGTALNSVSLAFLSGLLAWSTRRSLLAWQRAEPWRRLQYLGSLRPRLLACLLWNALDNSTSSEETVSRLFGQGFGRVYQDRLKAFYSRRKFHSWRSWMYIRRREACGVWSVLCVACCVVRIACCVLCVALCVVLCVVCGDPNPYDGSCLARRAGLARKRIKEHALSCLPKLLRFCLRFLFAPCPFKGGAR